MRHETAGNRVGTSQAFPAQLQIPDSRIQSGWIKHGGSRLFSTPKILRECPSTTYSGHQVQGVDVPGFLKAATTVMSSSAILGAGVLAMLPEEPSTPSSATVSATMRLPNVPPTPCIRPLWPNANGACQAWTLPHRDVEGLLASEPTRAGASRESTVRGRTARAENIKARKAHAEKASRRISVARNMTPTQRGFTSWPTWGEDAFRPEFRQRRNDTMRMFAFFGTQAR